VHDSHELAGGIQLEEQLSKNTARYNKLLTEEPSNVELWLKYVQFQVFSPVTSCMNLVDTSHAISSMYLVMYSFTTHNSRSLSLSHTHTHTHARAHTHPRTRTPMCASYLISILQDEILLDHIQCGRCWYTCSRELYKWLQACAVLTVTCV